MLFPRKDYTAQAHVYFCGCFLTPAQPQRAIGDSDGDGDGDDDGDDDDDDEDHDDDDDDDETYI